MELKNIKDYIHLYLGRETNHGTLVGIELDWATIRDNDGELFYGLISDLKPILRKLSSMTEDEVNECWKLLGYNDQITTPSIKRNFIFEDFSDKDNVESVTGWTSFCVKLLPYLLSKGFDLFGLIDANLAIDKDTL
jgi:hypothetical protein